MALLFQPGFVLGQYRDSYFCTWHLPDPKPQHIYGLYLLQKDFHGASGGLDQCYCHDHMTVETHGELPQHLCGGNTHPQSDKWCKLGASECLYPTGIKYNSELRDNLLNTPCPVTRIPPPLSCNRFSNPTTLIHPAMYVYTILPHTRALYQGMFTNCTHCLHTHMH